MEKIIEPAPHKKSITRRIIKISFILLVLFVLAIFSLVALVFYYEDDIKSAVIIELNKNLNAEIKVEPENINLTFFRTFPDCSIEFRDLLMLEALKLKRRDTLLFAGKLNLYFNIENIWNKKYEIERISFSSGLINLMVLKDGRVNYKFWKESEAVSATHKKDSLQFKLNLITIDKSRFKYKDKQDNFKVEAMLDYVEMKGSFRDDAYQLAIIGETQIKTISKHKSSYLRNKKCDFELAFNVKENLYEISLAKVKINQMGLELKGKLLYSDSLEKVNLSFNAPRLDISSLISLLPQNYTSRINDYVSDGNFLISGKLDYNGKGKYEISSKFGMSNTVITYKPNDIKADHINLEGHLYVSPNHSALELKKIHLNLFEEEMSGNCLINNFENPSIELDAKSNLRLENIIKFFPIDTITLLSGKLNLDVKLAGNLEDLRSKSIVKKIDLKLMAVGENLKLQFKGDEKVFSLERGNLKVEDGEVLATDCKLMRGGSDVLLNAKIPGLFTYLIDRSSGLNISGTMFSKNLILEDFMIKYLASESKDEPIIPENINFILDVNIDHFSYAKFTANKVGGNIEIKRQKAIISDMTFNTMEGTVEMEAFIDNSEKKLDVVLQSKLDHINITQLFTDMRNFDQSTLIDKNLKGYLSADFDLKGKWSNSLEPDYSSISADGELTIDKGELNNFQPMLSLSKYVDVKDLEHIVFSKLNCSAAISDQLITIQKTSINNSAMNIDFYGSHSFNNEINYHIQLLLSDLISKKRKNKESEFGAIERDLENKRTAFIWMTGTVDNPIIKYDKEALKNKVKDNIKNEKEDIKKLLKEEFGFFKRDTVTKKKAEPETKFELEKQHKTPAKKPLEPKNKEEDDEGDF